MPDIMTAMDLSARQYDANGWFEIPDNPLSRTGVFSYRGSMLGADFAQDKIYNVLRPEEELSDPECMDSFRLLPWIDNHVFLGKTEDGYTPPEKKGVQGVIGENVTFDFATGVLKSNIKVFSQSMGNLIAAGKKELSLGYRCVYEKKNGVYHGVQYDAIQRKIRGNHVALVDKGRMGSQVAVLDHLEHFTVTIDAKDIDMEPIKVLEKKVDDQATALQTVTDSLKTAMDALTDIGNKVTKLVADADGDAPAEDKPKDDAETDPKETEDKKAKKGMDANEFKAALDAAVKPLQDQIAELKGANPAMDAKDFMSQLSRRDAMANSLSAHVGTFDHASMTEDEVVAYGIDKLGLTDVAKGQERATLDGFLRAKPAPHKAGGFRIAADTGSVSSIRKQVTPSQAA